MLQLMIKCLFKVTVVFPHAHLCISCPLTLFKYLLIPTWLLLEYVVKRKQALEDKRNSRFRLVSENGGCRAAGHLTILESEEKKYSLRLGSCVASATTVCGGENVPRMRGGGQRSGRSTAFYEPADAVVQEHVVLIGSRARPRPR